MTTLKRTFQKRLTNQIRDFKNFYSKGEFTELEEELIEFEKDAFELPMIKQHQFFMEKIGSMYESVIIRKQTRLLKEISKSLIFLNFWQLFAYNKCDYIINEINFICL